MILEAIRLLLSPLIWPMELAFNGLLYISGSAGLSVILLAVTVSLAITPLRIRAIRVENRIRSLKARADAQIASEGEGLRGEARFRVVERAYAEQGYNPFHGIFSGLSFLVALPFLIAALFLFHDNPQLSGISFLFIPDLSTPDGLLFGVNLLPIAMSLLTVMDALYRFGGRSRAFLQFVFIALVLFLLVYGLGAALVLYWTANNLMAFLIYLVRPAKADLVAGKRVKRANTDAKRRCMKPKKSRLLLL